MGQATLDNTHSPTSATALTARCGRGSGGGSPAGRDHGRGAIDDRNALLALALGQRLLDCVADCSPSIIDHTFGRRPRSDYLEQPRPRCALIYRGSDARSPAPNSRPARPSAADLGLDRLGDRLHRRPFAAAIEV